MRYKKLKCWQWFEKFYLPVAKKVSQLVAKGESIICKSELKFWKLPNQKWFDFDNMSIFLFWEQLPWFFKLEIMNWELEIGTYQAKARGVPNL